MNMEEALELTVDKWERGSFSYPYNDCVMSTIDYLVLLGYPDIAKPWRGKYHSAEEAKEILNPEGGLKKMMIREMRKIGLSEQMIPKPQRGDIVMLGVHGEEVLGLYLNPFCAVRSVNGVFRTRRLPIMGAWTCV